METTKDSLLIHKVEITNCGGFRGPHTLEFSTERQKNITIVMGASGRGKSTTFALIYWCLYGKFFKPKLKTTFTDEGLIHKYLLTELEVGKKVTASVTLTINDQKGEKYVLTRNLTATKLREESKKKFEKLNNSRINSGIQIETNCKMRMEDEKEGGLYTEIEESIINNELRPDLPNNLSDFVLFDGEKLLKFQNPEDAKEIIIDGIQKLSGLPIVESLINSAKHTGSEIRKIAAKKVDSADGDALASALEGAEDDVTKAEKKIKDNEGLLNANRILYNEIQERMTKTKAGKNVGDRIETQEETLKGLRKQEKNHNTDVKDFLFKKLPELLIRETLLKAQKDFARLQELGKIPTPITSEGIDNIKKTLICLCGRKFKKDDDVWQELARVKETITDSDLTAGIQQGRGLISQIVDQSDPKKIEKTHGSLDQTSTDLFRQIKLAKGDLEDLYEERRNLPQEGEETYEELDKKSQEIFFSLGKIQANIVEGKRELEDAEADKEGKQKRLDDAIEHGGKFQDDKDKITILETIVKFSKERKEEITEKLRLAAEAATNEYFMKSAPQKEEFKKVEITSNYDILALDDEDDVKETSMGQSHVLGLSYVFGCRNITKKDTFLFIDSPLHNISGEFRNEVADVLAKYLPDVQIALFVTDSEYIHADPEGAKPVRDILKQSNKIWKEYVIEICETEDGNRTRCFKEMK